ncbi:LLM class flavin-dependent oxidoreductase [Streptomyces violascens]|uniref:Alkanesulfonate monooxygenase n=1 Tax=Streptomyces violascens TaxID=67381 RepID=A0ABQ3QN20_9ACTN|nr:LLM class flavin-dependent oxidoreductase [Streptomyces violascens]GGU41931.1 alkanesulfonate monooxygenase [Streptomyces violascens]GHI38675.1 alkanesulfonate monooxygenase [Streptomyces violascens]
MSQLRFHWGSALDDGQKKSTQQYASDVLDLDGAIEFTREADELGVDSLLMAQSFDLPDPLPIIGVFMRETRRLKFILAYRPGLLSPTLFTQVVNTFSWMSEGRISLNVIAGISPAEQAYYGDFLAHDARYERANEFLEILHAFWRGETPLTYEGSHYRLKDAQLSLGYHGGGRPEILISGASGVAQRTAVRHGDVWFRYADTPEEIAKSAAPVLAQGGRVGLRMQVLTRDTREEALAELAEVMSGATEERKKWVADFVATADSQAVHNSFRLADEAGHGWMSQVLYSGAVAYRGGPALCLVGSHAEVAAYLMEYKAAGIGEFIFSGWPARDEMRNFFTRVLPLVRELEEKEAASSPAAGASMPTG